MLFEPVTSLNKFYVSNIGVAEGAKSVMGTVGLYGALSSLCVIQVLI